MRELKLDIKNNLADLQAEGEDLKKKIKEINTEELKAKEKKAKIAEQTAIIEQQIRNEKLSAELKLIEYEKQREVIAKSSAAQQMIYETELINRKLAAAQEEEAREKRKINEKISQEIWLERVINEKKAAIQEEARKEEEKIDLEYIDRLAAAEEKIKQAKAGGKDEEVEKAKAAKKALEKEKKDKKKALTEQTKAAEKAAEESTKKESKGRLKLRLAEIATEAKERKNREEEIQKKIAEGTVTQAELNQLAKDQLADELSPDKIAGKITGWVSSLDSTMNDIAKTSTKIETRLQGSNNKKAFDTFGRTYWKQISNDMMSVAGASVFITQEDWKNNLLSMVDQGIAFNLEQRSFLATIKDEIATTFDAADATLLKLVRIQQADTTASRLGMEAALNEFLNNMYETTEYLKDVASTVRSNLYEAEALMDAASATAFEFEVQKWSGSMYSVGMSQDAIGGISSVVGKLASGDISALTGDGYGNLLVMAAQEAGLSISDALQNGLDATTTNELLEAMVNYLGKMYNESSDSLVIQQQLANVYGIRASDLKAAQTIANDNKTLSAIVNNNMTYNDGITKLEQMANTMYQRTSMASMLENAKANMSYSLAASVANNPASYMVWQMSNMLDELVGGIALPMISVMGNTVDLHTTVADLMKVGALAGGVMTSAGGLISGLGNAANGGGMLRTLGINSNKISTITRGTGTSTKTRGKSTSSSGYIGNGAGAQEKTMSDANDDSSSQLASAKEEEGGDVELKDVNDSIGQIIDILKAAVDSDGAFKTSASGYSMLGYNPCGSTR